MAATFPGGSNTYVPSHEATNNLVVDFSRNPSSFSLAKWAQIVPMSGREFLAAAAEQSEVRGRIVIRHRGNVDATMRVVYRGKYYNIHAVLPDAESGVEHLTLMVGEGVRLDQ